MITRPYQQAVQCITLAEGVDVHDVVDRCAVAWVDFVRDVSRESSRVAIARWLMGPYQEAIAWNTEVGSGTQRISAPCDQPIEIASLERVLGRARSHALGLLRECSAARKAIDAAHEMMERGLLIAIRDARGSIGYAPIGQARMSLADRVAALILADSSTRPRDFESLTICDECEDISFDWAPSHYESCSKGRVDSQVVPKYRTMPWFGRVAGQ